MSSKNNTTHLLTQNSNDTPKVIAAGYECDLINLVLYFNIQIYQYHYLIHQFTQKFKSIIFMYINLSVANKRIPHIQGN